jgi:hypothetical protein
MQIIFKETIFPGIPPVVVHHADTIIHKSIMYPPILYPALNALGAGSYTFVLHLL